VYDTSHNINDTMSDNGYITQHTVRDTIHDIWRCCTLAYGSDLHFGLWYPVTDPQKLTFQPCVGLWLSCHKRNTH